VLLVTVGSGWFSFLVLSPAGPVLYRAKALPPSEREAGARDRFVASEVFPTLEYYRSRLGGSGLVAAWLAVTGAPCERVAWSVSEQAGVAAAPLSLSPLLTLEPAAAAALRGPTALAARGLGAALQRAAVAFEEAAS
jgi:hypothetical protein